MPNSIASALATLATSYRDYLLDKQYQQMIDKILSQITQPYQLPQTVSESKIPEVPPLPKIENVVKELQQKAPIPTGELKPPEIMPSITPVPAPVSTAPEPQRPLDITSIISTEEEQVNQQIKDLMTEYQRQKDNQTKALLDLMRNPAFRMMPAERQQAIMQMTAIATEPKIDPNMIDYLIQTRENLRKARIEGTLQDILGEKEFERQKKLTEWQLKQYEPQVREIEGEKVLYFPKTGEILPVKELYKNKWVFFNVGNGVIVRIDAYTGEMAAQSFNPQINLNEILEKEAQDRNIKVEDILKDPFLTISILFKYVPNTDTLKDILTAIKWAYSLKKQPVMFNTFDEAIISANKLKKLYPDFDFIPDPDPKTGGYDIKVYKKTEKSRKVGYTQEEAERIAQEITAKHPGYEAIAVPTRNKGEWSISIKKNNVIDDIIEQIYGYEISQYYSKQPIYIPQQYPQSQPHLLKQYPQSQPSLPTSKSAIDYLKQKGLLK